MLSKEKALTRTDVATAPEPAESDRAVVFQGDGEPKSFSGMLSTLAAFDSNVGYEPDNYTLGGTVQALEEKLADLLGKEAAIFLPTGTMANHFAIRALCGSRPRAVVQERSHLYNDTGALRTIWRAPYGPPGRTRSVTPPRVHPRRLSGR